MKNLIAKIGCFVFGHDMEPWVRWYVRRVKGRKSQVRKTYQKCTHCGLTKAK